MKIAVSGKGGVGKTTISANLARLFAKKGYDVIAVDADPDSSLGLALGLDEDELQQIRPMIEKQDLVLEKSGDGAMYSLNPLVDDVAEKFSITTPSGIRFLRMGGVKKGGSACYCRENTFLKAVVNSLILDTKAVVIMDMGAGIEHLTRGTSSCVDEMIIVTEPGRSSVQTTRIVASLAKDIGIQHIDYIANKVRNERDEQFIQEHYNASELLGMIHYDDSVAEKGMGIGQSQTEVDNEEIEKILEQVVRMAEMRDR